MLTAKEKELEQLERLAYLKDEDPSYKPAWKKLRDKLWNDEKTKKYAKRNTPILVQLRSGESKTYESKADVVKALGINFRTLSEYIDTDKPVKGGKSNAKGCYFYSLPKEDE